MANHDASTVTRIAGIIYRHPAKDLGESTLVARLILDELSHEEGTSAARRAVFRALRGWSGRTVDMPYRGRRVIVDVGPDGSFLESDGIPFGIARNAREMIAMLRDLDAFIDLGRDAL